MNKLSKIVWSLFSGVVCLVYRPENANAGNLYDKPCQAFTGNICLSLDGISYEPKPPANCKTATPICAYIPGVGVTYLYSLCTACEYGYILTKKNKMFPSVPDCPSNADSDQYYFYECECKCNNCTSSGTWTAKGTGYEQRVGKGCNCSSGTATCITSTYYRCAAGYYGTTSNGTSGCTKCPDPGTSIAGNNGNISGCYIPEGTYSDATGKYALSCNCLYNGTDSCESASSSSV